MRLLIVSATGFEMTPLLALLDNQAVKKSFTEYEWGNHIIHPLVTGVGMVNTALALATTELLKEVDIAVQMGIAGSYNPSFVPGSVVQVTKDRFADLGVEEADGSFTDVYEMQLCPPDTFPFEDGWIPGGECPLELNVPKATGLTVNKVHGTASSIALIKKKYTADAESMEGAAFFYTCRLMGVKCIQIRAISNWVEPRNRNNWQLDKAIENVNREVISLIENLNG